MNKQTLRAQILNRLQAELQLQTSAAQLARDEAISEESRAENKYDTHGQEAAYLAEAQARLAAEIQAAISVYATFTMSDYNASTPIGLGAIITLSANGKDSWYLLGPRAGGLELSLSGHDVLLITPQSPIGRLLIGRRAGDTVQPPGRGSPVAYQIVAVH
ncbi:MAG: GreA/GreB family elongation factor [Opitutaceae bacterium]|nr:GreA/GreB family elongation factor [Opitutaceae bacterium]